MSFFHTCTGQVYAFYAFYAWWIHFPQSGALAEVYAFYASGFIFRNQGPLLEKGDIDRIDMHCSFTEGTKTRLTPLHVLFVRYEVVK